MGHSSFTAEHFLKKQRLCWINQTFMGSPVPSTIIVPTSDPYGKAKV